MTCLECKSLKLLQIKKLEIWETNFYNQLTREEKR